MEVFAKALPLDVLIQIPPLEVVARTLALEPSKHTSPSRILFGETYLKGPSWRDIVQTVPLDISVRARVLELSVEVIA